MTRPFLSHCSPAVLGAFVLFAALSAAGCGSARSEAADGDPVSVQTVTPERRAAERSLRLVGHVEPWEQAVLYSKVAGYLESIRVDVGSWVKRGQLIAKVDDPETGKQYEEELANANTKETVYTRLKAANEKNPDMVSQMEVDRAKGELDACRAALAKLQRLVGFSEIRAPYDGVITDRWVDPGALIQMATSSQGSSARIARIMSFDKVRVRVDVPEGDAPLLREGHAARIKIAELPGGTIESSVSRIAWAIDPTTRTMQAEIDTENPDHKIRPGMFATVEIDLVSGGPALVVPSDAIIMEGDRHHVWTVSEGTAHRVSVTVGQDNGIHAEILDGLDGSEQVVIMGQRTLVEGGAVMVVGGGKAASPQS